MDLKKSSTDTPEQKSAGVDPELMFLFVGLVLFLLNPVAVILGGILYAIHTALRLAPAWYGLAGLVYTIGLIASPLWSGAINGYLRAVQGIVPAVREGGGLAGLATHLPYWLIGQVPLAISIALLGGAAVFSWLWKQKQRASDHPEQLGPGPFQYMRFRSTVKAIKADKHPPKNGITIGTTPYGVRVVQTDQEGAAHTLVTGGSGAGKALDVDTLIPTPNGWVRMGDLRVGDSVFGEHGTPVRVAGAFDPFYDHDCYEVRTVDGVVEVADAEHLWLVETAEPRKSVNRRRHLAAERHMVYSDALAEKVRTVLAQSQPGDTVSKADVATMLGLPAGDIRVHGWLKQRELVAVGVEHAPPYIAQYGDKAVQRMKGAPRSLYRAEDVWPVVLERLETPLNDQRGRVTQARVMTTVELAALLNDPNQRQRPAIRLVSGPVQYPERELPLDPYLLGLWLGDGNTAGGGFTTADPELVDAWTSSGFDINPRGKDSAYDYYVRGLHGILNRMGVRGNKHVPADYLIASETQRRALLAGLLDTDGNVERGCVVSFTNKNEALADAVHELAASLGYRPTRRTRTSTLKGKEHGPYHVIRFSAADQTPFRLARKAVRHTRGMKSANAALHETRTVESVTRVPTRPVRCIKVDSDTGLFLAGRSYLVTHNTTTMLSGIRDVIRMGRGLVFVDLKGSHDVPAECAKWAARYNRKFLHWTIQDPRAPYIGPAESPAFYDPVGRGDPSRRKDLVVGSQKWDVEYYKTVISNYLQTAFTVAALVPPPAGTDGMSDLAKLLEVKHLQWRASRINPEQHANVVLGVEHITDGMGPTEQSAIRNMYARLQTLINSTAGAWLRRDPSGEQDIDLARAADEGWVVVFSLDSSNYEETSAQLAGLIVQDLKTLSSQLRAQPGKAGPLHVYIDEFSAAGHDNVLGLLARARDARMPTTLSSQALADLRRANPDFLDQVIGIVSNFLIHRANALPDAEVYAGLTGKERVQRRTSRVRSKGMFGGRVEDTGDGSTHTEMEYRVTPDQFQDLPQGQCIYITKAPSRLVNPVVVVKESDEAGPGANTKPKGGGGPLGGVLSRFSRQSDSDEVADEDAYYDQGEDTRAALPFEEHQPQHGHPQGPPQGPPQQGWPAQPPQQGWPAQGHGHAHPQHGGETRPQPRPYPTYDPHGQPPYGYDAPPPPEEPAEDPYAIPDPMANLPDPNQPVRMDGSGQSGRVRAPSPFGGNNGDGNPPPRPNGRVEDVPLPYDEPEATREVPIYRAPEPAPVYEPEPAPTPPPVYQPPEQVYEPAPTYAPEPQTPTRPDVDAVPDPFSNNFDVPDYRAPTNGPRLAAETEPEPAPAPIRDGKPHTGANAAAIATGAIVPEELDSSHLPRDTNGRVSTTNLEPAAQVDEWIGRFQVPTPPAEDDTPPAFGPPPALHELAWGEDPNHPASHDVDQPIHPAGIPPQERS